MSVAIHTPAPSRFYETTRTPETIPLPKALAVQATETEEKEGHAFYIVTSLAGVTMFGLAILSVTSMVVFFAMQIK